MQRNSIIIKKTSESKEYFSHAVVPYDLNGGGSVYGARLLEWADNLSGLVALKHRRGAVTTAAFDQFNFVKPIMPGHLIHGEAFISGTGKISMEIFLKFVAEDPVTGNKYLAAYGFITYVAKKLAEGEFVAGIEGETEEELKIMAGYEERKMKLREKIEINKEMESHIEL